MGLIGGLKECAELAWRAEHGHIENRRGTYYMAG